jgi:hypothetical protein
MSWSYLEEASGAHGHADRICGEAAGAPVTVWYSATDDFGYPAVADNVTQNIST